MRRAQTVTVDAPTRMELNGETSAQMRHFRNLKQRDYDTSRDEHWEIDHSLVWRDRFVLAISAIWIPLKLVPLVPMLVMVLPSVLAAWLFGRCQRAGTDRLVRKWNFWAVCWIAQALFVPCLATVFVSLALDYLVYYVVGMSFTACTWRWKQCYTSHRVLDPYRCAALAI
jgi:hypothetical protein